MEEWTEVPNFPGYSVSTWGRIKNDETDHILSQNRTETGIIYVGMVSGGVQFKRGVALLVANAFLPTHDLITFDTPINLDGDRTNNHIDNLLWRPNWFARNYHRQFRYPPTGVRRPVADDETGEQFPTSWEAATKFGLIDREIYNAVHTASYVWPTYQFFRLL